MRVSVACAKSPLSCATSAPPEAQLLTGDENAPPTCSAVQPSVGATAPALVLQEYTWYSPACAAGASAATAAAAPSTALMNVLLPLITASLRWWCCGQLWSPNRSHQGRRHRDEESDPSGALGLFEAEFAGGR